jgi:hypothetical protein
VDGGAPSWSSAASSITTGTVPRFAPKCTSDSFSTIVSPLRSFTTPGPNARAVFAPARVTRTDPDTTL